MKLLKELGWVVVTLVAAAVLWGIVSLIGTATDEVPMNQYEGLGLALAVLAAVTVVTAVVAILGVLINRMAAQSSRADDR